ncbi:hypothetical protein ElyMa_000968100 [Elysia marginata]|uniref:Uncharacterized protein n=1 Tax=Elysia marginata TaxID=1093978 RepID=A0AAV4HFP6_9GAST|nr:hypothetical protein ElyMa_000968100 [Elysia marginata]
MDRLLADDAQAGKEFQSASTRIFPAPFSPTFLLLSTIDVAVEARCTGMESNGGSPMLQRPVVVRDVEDDPVKIREGEVDFQM